MDIPTGEETTRAVTSNFAQNPAVNLRDPSVTEFERRFTASSDFWASSEDEERIKNTTVMIVAGPVVAGRSISPGDVIATGLRIKEFTNRNRITFDTTNAISNLNHPANGPTEARTVQQDRFIFLQKQLVIIV